MTDPLIDAAPARAHLQELLDRGLGLPTLAGAAGLARTTVANVAEGRNPRVRQHVADQILALPVDLPPAGTDAVPAQPVREHVQALLDRGVSIVQLTAASGLGRKVICAAVTPDAETVRADVAAALLAVPADLVPQRAPRKNQVGSEAAMARLRAWQDQHASISVIAEHVGVSASTIKGVLARDPAWIDVDVAEAIAAAPDELPVVSSYRQRRPNLIDAAPTIARLRGFVEAGHTSRSLARASGVNASTVRGLIEKPPQQVNAAIAAAIQELPLDLPTPAREESTPAEPVLAHLDELVRLGKSWKSIGEATGVSWSTIKTLHANRWKTVRVGIATALLAMPAAEAPDDRVDSGPAAAHVRELRRLGASNRQIADAAGLDPNLSQRLMRANPAPVLRAEADALLGVTTGSLNIDRLPVDRARTHVLELLERGLSAAQIAAAAKVTNDVVMSLAHGERHWIFKSTQDALLAVDYDAVDGPLLVDAAPAREHILALRAGGATDKQIAAAVGVANSIITKVRNGSQTRLHRDTAAWIQAVTPEQMPARAQKVPAEAARVHLQELLDAGCGITVAALGRALGLPKPSSVSDLLRSRVKRIDPALEAKALELTVEEVLDLEAVLSPWGHVEMARAHLQDLVDLGYSLAALSSQSGLNARTLSQILSPDGTSITRETEQAILALSPLTLPNTDGAHVDPTGTYRRVQALRADGWTDEALSAHLGEHVYLPLMDNEHVSAKTARMVRAVFDRIGGAQGPNGRTRKNAARRGWVPAAYWDPSMIDDPSYVPVGMPFDPVVTPMAIRRDYLVEYLRAGIPAKRAASLLGLQLARTRDWLIEHAPDVLDALDADVKEDLYAQARKLFAVGMNYRDVAEVLRVRQTTAIDWRRQYDADTTERVA